MKNLKEQLERIRLEYGPWTAHNIRLTDDVYTIDALANNRAAQRANIYLYFIKQFSKRRSYRLKILDLGCLEGGISIELAKSGFNCTGVDVRKSHLVKAIFASSALGLNRKTKWVHGDVTKAEFWRRIGQFDIVICSGLLYHIEANAIIDFLKNVSNACRRNGLVIVDSNITRHTNDSLCYEDNIFRGVLWKEHDPEDTLEERLSSPWSSLENNSAFWLTERSLVNALVTAGLPCIVKPMYPYHEWNHQCRDIWVAFKNNLKSDPSIPLRRDPDPRPIEHPMLG